MDILYIEDNEDDVELARLSLSRLAPEFVLHVVADCAQAMERLRDPAGLDLVLCDLRLPDGSGFDVLTHIRARDLPLAVVIVTSEGDQETAVAALRADADGYLIKGLDAMMRLPKTLRRALRRHRASRGVGERPVRVLHVDGDSGEVEALRAYLAQRAPHISLETVADCAQALARLRVADRRRWDVLLLSFAPPGDKALELVEILRGEQGDDLPIVLLSDAGNEALASRAIALGVDDYLIKHPSYLHELPVTLENAFHRAELAREHGLLLEREGHTRLLLESLAEGVYGVDMEGRCTFVNQSCLRILGFERAEDMVGQHIHELIHHHHADGSPYPSADCRMYQAYLRDKAIHRDDEVFWRRDGTAVPVEYRSYPLHHDGRVVGAVATFMDIGERRRAEERLRQAAMVFENTRDGVSIADPEGRILAVNPGFSTITGYSEAEILGKSHDFLLSDRHDQAFIQVMWASVRANGFWKGEVWNRRKNGEAYPELLSIIAVRDESGQPRNYVGVGTDLSQIRHSQKKLDYLAHYDPLTELPNRALLRVRLDHALERAHRHGHPLALMHIDLDNFKAVNDSLGHVVGDQLLRAMAERLSGRVRKEDTLARLDGDEFLLLLEAIDESQEAATVADDLLTALAQPFASPEGREVYLNASIGIGIYPDDADNAARLRQAAETAMHRAKAQGRGQFCFYTPDMNADALANLELEAALRRALERGELELHYQPKVDLQTGQPTGAEALLRWRRGSDLVPPGSFIPLAEKSGLIVPIGAWVIDTACAQIRAWREAGLREMRVAVNVSARQFRAGNLETVVSEALARHEVSAGNLELELTESILMEDPQAAVGQLDRLKAVGVKLSLDDFGTGYSSLAYLRRFPIDVLKIDQSFVRDMITEPHAAGIVAAIIGLAQRMHLGVVAEGVETEAQLNCLCKQGCDTMQGYLFSRPLPAGEFAALMRAGRRLPLPAEPGAGERTLLLVDDEANILAALRRLLHSEGYRVLTAGSAREGLELLARNEVQVVVSDQRMPVMSGSEFLARVRDLYPDTVRMVLSGFSEIEGLIQAINEGAIFRFLTKPWDAGLLRGHIREAFRYHEAVIKGRGRAARADMAAVAEESGI